jgi:transposase
MRHAPQKREVIMSEFVKRTPVEDATPLPEVAEQSGGSAAAGNLAGSPGPAAPPAAGAVLVDLDALGRDLGCLPPASEGPPFAQPEQGGPGPWPSPAPPPAADEVVVDLDELGQDLGWSPPAGAGPALPRREQRRRGRRLVAPAQTPPAPISPEQRLLLLDTWRRSGLPAGDFAALVGVSKHTLREWQRRFDAHGPAGLLDQPRGQKAGSRVPDLTKRTILMLKAANPDWGCQKISDLLLRGPALPASPAAVARVLHEAGYELEETPTRPHEPPVRHFERARPNQLWQTDLFTFILDQPS